MSQWPRAIDQTAASDPAALGAKSVFATPPTERQRRSKDPPVQVDRARASRERKRAARPPRRGRRCIAAARAIDHVDLDLTGADPVTTALLDPRPLPQSDRERDVSRQHVVAQLAAELHAQHASWCFERRSALSSDPGRRLVANALARREAVGARKQSSRTGDARARRGDCDRARRPIGPDQGDSDVADGAGHRLGPKQRSELRSDA